MHHDELGREERVDELRTNSSDRRETFASTTPEKHELRGRLRAFWNAQQCYWDGTSSGECVESPIRQRATSFVPTGSSVLDVACGTAANSAWLKDRCHYVGIDLSIKALQQPLHRSLRLACADAGRLPFRKESFDAVMSSYVLEHTVEPVETLREMCRVVRPGGAIVLVGPAWDFPFWYPNSLRSKSGDSLWRLRYTYRRFCGQLLGWWFGRLPFASVDDPDAFHSDFIYDADAVYIVWTYEVIRVMKEWGHRLVHWEVDDRLLGTSSAVRSLKRLLLLLPIYKYAGSTVTLVFEK